jgi:FMN phosphatase YigB (HAD superfamily)
MNTILPTSPQNEELTPRKKYYVTQDTPAVLRRLLTVITGSKTDEAQEKAMQSIADDYKKKVIEILQKYDPDRDVVYFDESLINRELEELVTECLREQSDSKVICMDRFLLTEPNSPNGILRFEMTRLANGEKGPRPGSMDLDAQLDLLLEQCGSSPVVIVDDGFYTGGTIQFAVKLMIEKGINVTNVVCFGRNPEKPLPVIDGVSMNWRIEMKEIADWFDERDLKTFFGRTQPKDPSLPYDTTLYYLSPTNASKNIFSFDGEDVNEKMRAPLSQELLDEEYILLTRFERELIGGTRVRIQDILDSGYAVPDFRPFIELPETTDSVRSYVSKVRNLVACMQLPLPDELVVDMDGTFYSLDGTENGFAGSTLEQEIRTKAVELIAALQNCDAQAAEIIFAQAVQDSIGASRYISRRYGITRERYFEETWGKIDEAKIVKNPQQAAAILQELKGRIKTIRLLTSAPRCWMQRVFKLLQVDTALFDEIVTAEDCGSKAEFFEKISVSMNGNKILSVGDDPRSDIASAEKVGISGMLVSSSNPLSNIRFLGKYA